MSDKIMYEIRFATYDEVPLLPAIEQAACDLFLQYEATAALPLYLTPLEDFYEAQRDNRLWVATLYGASPVGFALVEMIDDMAHLEELDVNPQHGQRGIGTKLVKTVCEWARIKGIAAITLTTFREIPWNAPFYQKLGFRILEIEELTRGLMERIELEESHGLSRELRVVMQYDTKVVW
ncbi:MAG: GNAT family N-acetyltransferase [Acidobacteriota bacterium]